MLKVIPLLITIVTTITIVQPSRAINTANYSPSPESKPVSSNLHAQVILDFGNSRSRSYRERERERERRRERERERYRHQGRRHERYEDRQRYRYR
ncbi:MAG: hypothetical protein PUP92_17885 [Rhizonema sp. PD38]|nr:hypothetical protein [Rhizonema sp. PD38]